MLDLFTFSVVKDTGSGQGSGVRSGSGCGEEKTRCGVEETGCGEEETGCGEEKVYFWATVLWSFLGRAPLGNCPQSEEGREPQMPVGPHVSLPRKTRPVSHMALMCHIYDHYNYDLLISALQRFNYILTYAPIVVMHGFDLTQFPCKSGLAQLGHDSLSDLCLGAVVKTKILN